MCFLSERGAKNMWRNYLKKNSYSDYAPFIPLLETIFRMSGTVKKELNVLFPSYVFIESPMPSQEFLEGAEAIRRASRDIIRILRYSDTEIAMRDSEKDMLMKLCNDDYCIETSKGIMEKDRIHVLHGPLKGLESIVRKVNRHKRKAWIEIEFMGEVRLVSVSLEIIQKIG